MKVNVAHEARARGPMRESHRARTGPRTDKPSGNMGMYTTRLYLCTCLVALVTGSPAQNLIQNQSFEEYSITCFGGVDYLHLLNWSTPDCGIGWVVFHTCNAPAQPTVSVPGNYFGWEQPHSGSAYCGISPFTSYVSGGNVKPYGSIEFSSPLVGGTDYCLRFYLSRGDSTAYSTGALHAFLWYGIPSTCNHNDTAWDTYAAATFDLSVVDTSGWTLLEAPITAQGGETSLTLGSFLYGADIDTTYLGPEYPRLMAMYYIDDVYVGPCDVSVRDANTGTGPLLYPSPLPGGEPLTILWDDQHGTLDWELLNVNAAVIATGRTELCEGRANVPFHALAAGVYLLRLHCAAVEVRRRFVVR